MSQHYRAIIVDDERHAREDLRRQLAAHPQIEIIGEAQSVEEAAALIPQLSPNIVFLDIQMPAESGFRLLDRVAVDFKVVFVTAFDNYAVRAFEVNALDYLLKPINANRLAQAIARLSKTGGAQPAPDQRLNYDDHAFIQSQGRTWFIKVNSIVCILAEGDYTEIRTIKGEKRSVSKSLNEWESKLPDKNFLRIHRSTIINLDYLESFEPEQGGVYRVHLRGQTESFTTSSRRARALRKRI